MQATKKNTLRGLGVRPKIRLAGGARCLRLSRVARNGAREFARAVPPRGSFQKKHFCVAEWSEGVCARRPSARFILAFIVICVSLPRLRFASYWGHWSRARRNVGASFFVWLIFGWRIAGNVRPMYTPSATQTQRPAAPFQHRLYLA